MNSELMTLAEFGWNQFWQVSCLVLIVAAVVKLFCKRRPHLAYLLWMLVIVKCLTPPVWSSQLGVFSWCETVEFRSRNRSSETRQVDSGTDTEMRERPTHNSNFDSRPNLQSHDEANNAEPAFFAGRPGHAKNAKRKGTIIFGIGIVWATGVIGFGVGFTFRWSRFLRRLKSESEPLGASVMSLAKGLSEKLGIRRPVRFLNTSLPIVPCAFGIWRPTVLLPRHLVDTLTHDEIATIIAHELLHIRRWDIVAGRLQIVVQVLWWFHPFIWLANIQARRQRERCCDRESVASLRCAPATYARMLINVLEHVKGMRPSTGVVGMSASGSISDRIEDILNRADQFPQRTPKRCWITVCAIATFILPGAARVEKSAPLEIQDHAIERNSNQRQGSDEKTPKSKDEKGAAGLSVTNAPPVVVRTTPISGNTNVDPNLNEIKVTFSKRMTDGSWSWARISDDTFPEVQGPIRYLKDQRTCVARVKLKPDQTYVIWLNSEKFGNFRDWSGQPAIPYLLVFKTAPAKGE